MRPTAAVVVLAFVAACGGDAGVGADADVDAAADVDAVGVDGVDAVGVDGVDALETDADGDDVAVGVDADAVETDTDADADTDAPDIVDATADSVADSREPTELPETVTTVVRAPEAGELTFAELMIDPVGRSDLVGEWVELASQVDDATLDLASCWLEDAAGQRTTIASAGATARVSPRERFVIARSGKAAENGGVVADLVLAFGLMPNAGGSIALGCGDEELDRVAWDERWPLAAGRALVLPTPDADGARDPADACAATAIYDAGAADAAGAPNRGTPGAAGDPCPAPDPSVDACGLLAPAPGELPVGAPLRVVAWAFDAGATDLGPGPTPRVEPIPFFRAEGGLGPSADGIAWQSAEAAPDALDPAHAERDAWAVTLPSLAVGSWVAGFRFSLDAGATWQTCGTVAVLVRPSPCDPNPCVASASVACEGDVVATRPALGSCAVVGHDAQCSYPVERLDCAALGGRCEAGACVDVATWPEPGEVVVSEIMRNPNLVDDSVGEWLELVDVAARPVQLAGCTLSDDGTDLIALEDDAGALTMWPTGRLVLAASADPSQNGGVAADWGWAGHGKFELLNNADAVVLRCGGHVIDTVRYSSLGWPSTAGRAMQLSPRKEDADLNDDGDAWCSAASAIGGATFPDYGTPGAANSPCPEAVERCRFVAPAELDAVGGAPFTVAVQVRHAGLTDLSAGVDADPLLKVEAGLGPAGWYPTWGGWTFVAAAPDPDWSDLAPPMEDQWLATLVADPDDDAVDAAGRVSVDGGLTWTSCDRDSTLPGGDGSQDGYSPSNATRVTVVAPDPCLPNPCTNPPATACDADGSLVSYPALGACRADVDGASCDYAQDVVDCTALGGTCDAAARACVGALAHPGPGDLVVSEVMASPAAVADFFGEWFELTSVSGVDVNLAGCSLEDSESALTIDRPGHALVVLAGARVVLGRDAVSAENGGVAVDYAWGDGLGLGNAGDRIAIVCDGALVDEVVWDQAFPLGPGVAMQLDPGLVGAELNDASSAWCAAESAYGAGDLGTPGLANATCPP